MLLRCHNDDLFEEARCKCAYPDGLLGFGIVRIVINVVFGVLVLLLDDRGKLGVEIALATNS